MISLVLMYSSLIKIFDVSILIKSSSRFISDAVNERLPKLWQPLSKEPQITHSECLLIDVSPLDSKKYECHDNGDLIAAAANLDIVLDVMEAHLHHVVARRANEMLFIHAGVVGWKESAIIVAGPSKSGKTSLIASLIRIGCSYYSDEYAVIDTLGRVHPYPKRLSIRVEHNKPGKLVPAEEFGCKIGQEPLPVSLLVFTNYQSDAQWSPKQLSKGQSILHLMKNAFISSRDPLSAVRVLALAASSILSLSGPRPCSEQTAASLLAFLT